VALGRLAALDAAAVWRGRCLPPFGWLAGASRSAWPLWPTHLFGVAGAAVPASVDWPGLASTPFCFWMQRYGALRAFPHHLAAAVQESLKIGFR